MGEIKTWIENHPYLTSGLVVGIIVLFYLLSSSNSGAQSASQGDGLSAADVSLSEAQLASGTQLQAQQDQLTAQQNELQAGLSAAAISAATTDTANQLQAQTADQNIGGQVSIAQIQQSGQVSIAGIQGDVIREQYDQQTAQQKIIADAQTQQASTAASLAYNQSYLSAQTSQYEIQRQEQLDNLTAQTQQYQIQANNLQSASNERINDALIALLGTKTGN